MVIKALVFPEKDLFVKIFGNNVFLVGGAVRDILLTGEVKKERDIDLMVINESYVSLTKKLSPFGKTNTVGKSFAVLKFSAGSITYDISIPRRDTKIDPNSNSHKNFRVESGSDISLEEDLSRRDFTCNSIAVRIKDGLIFDPFYGFDSIKKKLIKMTSPNTFADDPLRLLRAARFSSVLEFSIEDKIYEESKKIDLSELSMERVSEEFIRMLLESVHPSIGFKEYFNLTIFKQILPEVHKMALTIQDSIFHPEKDDYDHHTVFIHTAIAIDVAKKVSKIYKLSKEEELTLLLSVVLHDIGKPQTTDWEFKRGRMTVTSLYHDSIGVDIAFEILERLNIDTRNKFPVRDIVLKMVKNHHRLYDLYSNRKVVGFKAFSRLLRDMEGRDDLLVYLDFSDRRSRESTPLEFSDLDKISKWYLKKKEELNIDKETIEPLIFGRDLISLGIEPGKEMGVFLDKLYNMQLDGKFLTKDEGLTMAKRILSEKSVN